MPTPTVSVAPGPVTSGGDDPGRRGRLRLVDDDETRFRQVFAEGYQPLTAYARRRTADRTAADDIVAETFAIAWRRRADLRPGAPVLPWLYGIAGNVLRNHWRSRGRADRLADRLKSETQSSMASPTAFSSTFVDPIEALDLPDPELHAALSRLSFDDQELLRLLTWEELSHNDVAEILGCSVNAVGIRAHRARNRLRAQLEAAQNPDPTTQPPSVPDPTRDKE